MHGVSTLWIIRLVRQTKSGSIKLWSPIAVWIWKMRRITSYFINMRTAYGWWLGSCATVNNIKNADFAKPLQENVTFLAGSDLLPAFMDGAFAPPYDKARSICKRWSPPLSSPACGQKYEDNNLKLSRNSKIDDAGSCQAAITWNTQVLLKSTLLVFTPNVGRCMQLHNCRRYAVVARGRWRPVRY